MILSDNFIINILGIFIAPVILIIFFFKKRYRYWKNLGIESMEPVIPFGNFSNVVFRKIAYGGALENYYNYLKKKNVKYGGCYAVHLPALVAVDLDLIKQIMRTDFDHFTDRGLYYNEKVDPLTAHLFALEGQRWRTLRAKLTPTFTSGKMKNMLPILIKASEELVKVLQKECNNRNPVDAKDISARFTTDIIGNCAFGLECNSLADPNVEFRVQGKKFFNLTWPQALSSIVAMTLPDVSRFIGIRLFPKVATDFFWNVIKDTVDYREQSGFQRDDAMQLLLDMKVKEDNNCTEKTLTFNELAAQAFVFFAAGFETSSTLMCFALLELAINSDVQDKLREEINIVLKKNDNELTYTALQEMTYLDMVIEETLRKHPPIPALSRICTKDYRIPDTDIVLRKGTLVLIPILGIHYDPEYYPNPKAFDPNRFNDENKSKRHHFAHLSFGEGPRICIGIRFGLMQAKIGIIAFIRNFRLNINPQTTLPVKLDPKSYLNSPSGEILLDLKKLTSVN